MLDNLTNLKISLININIDINSISQAEENNILDSWPNMYEDQMMDVIRGGELMIFNSGDNHVCHKPLKERICISFRATT